MAVMGFGAYLILACPDERFGADSDGRGGVPAPVVGWIFAAVGGAALFSMHPAIRGGLLDFFEDDGDDDDDDDGGIADTMSARKSP